MLSSYEKIQMRSKIEWNQILFYFRKLFFS